MPTLKNYTIKKNKIKIKTSKITLILFCNTITHRTTFSLYITSVTQEQRTQSHKERVMSTFIHALLYKYHLSTVTLACSPAKITHLYTFSSVVRVLDGCGQPHVRIQSGTSAFELVSQVTTLLEFEIPSPP